MEHVNVFGRFSVGIVVLYASMELSLSFFSAMSIPA